MLSEVVVRQVARDGKIKVVGSRSEGRTESPSENDSAGSCKQWSKTGAMLILGSRNRSA